VVAPIRWTPVHVAPLEEARAPRARAAELGIAFAPKNAQGAKLGQIFGVALPPASDTAPEPHAPLVSVTSGLLELEEPHAFGDFVKSQIETLPEAKKTFQAISDRVHGPTPPTTVSALLAVAREEAAKAIEGSSLASLPHCEHVTTLVALLALAGHSMPLEGSAAGSFPPYMPDGREIDRGYDKTQHFCNQAFFSYMVLFDRRFGDGSVASAFEGVVERSDADHRSEAILATHRDKPWYIGPLLAQSLPPVRGHAAPPPAARPTDLSKTEARAIAYTERLGASHEARTTSVPYDGDALGDHSALDDPLKRLESTIHVTSGVPDPGVRSELEANRIGGLAGIALMRNPKALLELPHDREWGWTHQPYGPQLPGNAKRYYGHEASMLEKLGGGAVSASGDLLEALASKVEAEVDRLKDADRPKLAAYYANFCVRQQAFGVGDVSGQGPKYEDFHDWAMTESPSTIAEHTIARMHAVFEKYAAKSSDAPPPEQAKPSTVYLDYFTRESLALARLGGLWEGGAGSLKPLTHRVWASQRSALEVMKDLDTKTQQQIDRLEELEDRAAIARYVADLVERQDDLGLELPAGDPLAEKDRPAVEAWAKEASREEILGVLTKRSAAIARELSLR
jgi:hypothetical protein